MISAQVSIHLSKALLSSSLAVEQHRLKGGRSSVGTSCIDLPIQGIAAAVPDLGAMAQEGVGRDPAEDVPNLLDKLDESQRNEAVGRLLKLENEDTWNEPLGPC